MYLLNKVKITHQNISIDGQTPSGNTILYMVNNHGVGGIRLCYQMVIYYKHADI